VPQSGAAAGRRTSASLPDALRRSNRSVSEVNGQRRAKRIGWPPRVDPRPTLLDPKDLRHKGRGIG
jgi:hypothetical protein